MIRHCELCQRATLAGPISLLMVCSEVALKVHLVLESYQHTIVKRRACMEQALDIT